MIYINSTRHSPYSETDSHKTDFQHVMQPRKITDPKSKNPVHILTKFTNRIYFNIMRLSIPISGIDRFNYSRGEK